MPIVFALEPELSAEDFRVVLVASTLGERRPVEDLARRDKMLRHADLIVTARDAESLGDFAQAMDLQKRPPRKTAGLFCLNALCP